jgi:hypothetical protein
MKKMFDEDSFFGVVFFCGVGVGIVFGTAGCIGAALGLKIAGVW